MPPDQWTANTLIEENSVLLGLYVRTWIVTTWFRCGSIATRCRKEVEAPNPVTGCIKPISSLPTEPITRTELIYVPKRNSGFDKGFRKGQPDKQTI